MANEPTPTTAGFPASIPSRHPGSPTLPTTAADLFASTAQTLVNPVNLVGVMGAGLARRFRDLHPAMFEEYRRLCRTGAFRPGHLHLWRGAGRWVLNIPTKISWRDPSSLSLIEAGLRRFRDDHARLGINSVAFPALGCGCGQLSWTAVRPLLDRYLADLAIPVTVHLPR